MSDWKNYFNDRLKREDESGFTVIVPKDTGHVIPFACPVCDMLLSTSEDSEYFRSKCCCYKCGLKWADQDITKWKSGWRPSQEEIDAEVVARQAIPVIINLDSLGR